MINICIVVGIILTCLNLKKKTFVLIRYEYG